MNANAQRARVGGTRVGGFGGRRPLGATSVACVGWGVLLACFFVPHFIRIVLVNIPLILLISLVRRLF